MKNIYVGLTKLNHHLCNLQAYNKCGVVPKGLFIKRKPTILEILLHSLKKSGIKPMKNSRQSL